MIEVFLETEILNMCADDPELFSSQPVCLQVVGFPYKDEELVAVSEVLDRVVNV